MTSRYIADTDKLKILERQKYRCANIPGANLYRLGDFPCLLWEGTRNGVFMDNLYEFDHIVEFCLTKDNSIDNIQALCPNCHSRRSKDFVKELALAKRKGIINEYSGNDGRSATPIRKRQKKRMVKPIYFSTEQIITVDEREYSIKSLSIKQKRRTLTETEQCILHKLKLIKLFGITNTDDRELLEEFLNEYIGQEMTFRRFEYFFGYNDDGTADDERRRELIVDILNRFLKRNDTVYASDDLVDVVIKGEHYDEILLDIITNSLYFSNELVNRSLFFGTTAEYKNKGNASKQHYVNTIQNMLRLYGIHFGAHKRYQVNGKRVYLHKLSVNGEIKDVMDMKYGIIDEIDTYEDLFN